MLLIIKDYHQLDYVQLMAVYEQSNRQRGAQEYSYDDPAEQLLQVEQEFYEYLQYILRDKQSVIAVWVSGGKYQAALRLEPYRGGMLVTGLETAPEARQRGYATNLLRAVLERYAGARFYSHIGRNNGASIRVHEKCGFQCAMDHAVFLDGSVSNHSYTYICDA